MKTTIPLIDLAEWARGTPADRQTLADAVDGHLSTLGFLMVANHGITVDTTAAARRVCRAFFELSPARKALYACPPDVYRGWVGPGLESNGASYGMEATIDLKEAYSIGPVFEGAEALRPVAPRWYAPNIWPDADVPGYRDAMLAWMHAADRVAGAILNILTCALQLAPDWTETHCNRAMATVTVNQYPPVSRSGGWRVGPHTDFGTVTVLDRDIDNGLQVEVQPGDWVEAPVVPNALTVNLGEMMVRFSGGRWRANPHRVAAVPGAPASLSLVYFHSPNFDTRLPGETPTGEGLSAGAFLGRKMDQIVQSAK